MEIKAFTNAHEFYEIVEKFLLQDESFYNLKLGLCGAIQKGGIQVTEPLYFALYEEGKLIGCALRTHSDRPLAISKMSRQAIEFLGETLINQRISLSGVLGEVEAANYFKELWTKKNSKSFKISIHLGIYEARDIYCPKGNFEIIRGTDNHKDIILKYIKGFSLECFPNQIQKEEEIENLCDRHINNKSIYLLRNDKGEIVSMAANSRGSINGGTISLVYTPPELRGLGYASLVTAKVSELVLKEKKFANLFTDLSNPTSNSIYQKIGFKIIGENIHYDFE